MITSWLWPEVCVQSLYEDKALEICMITNDTIRVARQSRVPLCARELRHYRHHCLLLPLWLHSAMVQYWYAAQVNASYALV